MIDDKKSFSIINIKFNTEYFIHYFFKGKKINLS